MADIELCPGYQGASKLRVKVVIIVIWSVATMVSIAPLLGWNRYTYEGYLISSTVDYLSQDSSDKIFNWMIFSIAWLGPSLVILYSHVKILRANRFVQTSSTISFYVQLRTNNQALFRYIGKTNGSATARKNIKIRRLVRVVRFSILLCIIISSAKTTYF